MKYKSTRGNVKHLSFIDAFMMGLADDGGLIIPESIPTVSKEQLKKMSTMSFIELTVEIMSMYIDQQEITHDQLTTLAQTSFQKFDHPLVCPITRIGNEGNLYILELFHGPTFSFKDVALQMLGSLFEFVLERRKQTMSVLVATSGDTGSAAIHGLANKKGVNVFVLYPQGRVSPIQELQMITVQDDNVHPIAIAHSSFDDCQTLVKQIFSDLAFKSTYNLAAVNSINWARILVQIVYYFYSYFQVQKSKHTDNLEVVFSVPTGNFGDILAGYYAKKMGLPITNLIVSTNQNDILDKFFKSGRYDKTGGDVIPTVAPSMDIKIASNFERYLYYVCQEDSNRLRTLMEDFNRDGVLSIPHDVLTTQINKVDGFISSSVGHHEIMDTIKSYHQQFKYLMDPHTAIGVAGTKYHGLQNDLIHFINNNKSNNETALICLSTAHPAKFGDTVKNATNVDIENQYEATKQLKIKQQQLQQPNNGHHLNVSICNCNIDQIKAFISSKNIKAEAK